MWLLRTTGLSMMRFLPSGLLLAVSPIPRLLPRHSVTSLSVPLIPSPLLKPMLLSNKELHFLVLVTRTKARVVTATSVASLAIGPVSVLPRSLLRVVPPAPFAPVAKALKVAVPLATPLVLPGKSKLLKLVNRLPRPPRDVPGAGVLSALAGPPPMVPLSTKDLWTSLLAPLSPLVCKQTPFIPCLLLGMFPSFWLRRFGIFGRSVWT